MASVVFEIYVYVLVFVFLAAISVLSVNKEIYQLGNLGEFSFFFVIIQLQ